MDIKEKINRKVEWQIKKWKEEDYKAGKDPYDVVKFDGNCLLNDGINLLTYLIAGDTANGYWGSGAYLGVGDDGTAESPSNTGLGGASQTFMGMDSSFPTYGSSQQIIWQATADGNTANHSWQEFCVSTSGAGTLLNRKTYGAGVKSAGMVWQLTLTITFS